MLYEDALEFIHGIARFGSKPGLKRVAALMESMGNPQDGLPFLHVAGTNGKGSTCAMLSHILTETGYKTGLFISPFVLDFRERIQIDNQMIPQSELAASVELVKKHWDSLEALGNTPTEFEVVFAVAIDYFLREKCDVVILEVGMGGRFDATNVIKAPVVSVITHIGIDHTEYLGETLEKIAMEKCGIIKPNGITVSYPAQPKEAAAIIAEHCKNLGNELLIAKPAETVAADIAGSDILYEGQSYRVPLGGAHQVQNAATVLRTVEALRRTGLAVKEAAVVAGLAKTRFPARLEVLYENPLVLLDGAHNPQGAATLAKALEMLKGRKIHAVVGCMADKDVAGMLKLVLPLCASVTATAPAVARAMPANELARIAMECCDDVYIAESMGAAVVQPLAHRRGDDVILIFGSLYLASEIRPVAQNVFSRFKDAK